MCARSQAKAKKKATLAVTSKPRGKDMDSLFLHLHHNLEALKSGIELRRRARRNWMERLMQEADTMDDQTAPEQRAHTVQLLTTDAPKCH